MIELNATSLKRFEGVHPDLVAVVKHAAGLSDLLFVVTEGLRSLERQKQLVAEGKSQTMKSRHLTGHAVDLAVWFDRDADKVVDVDEISWKFEFYKQLADTVKRAAQELGIVIEWGGDWKTLVDGPHFQLTWEQYP
jgi:peptidoglycan LD-endopeptidase CwlK